MVEETPALPFDQRGGGGDGGQGTYACAYSVGIIGRTIDPPARKGWSGQKTKTLIEIGDNGGVGHID